MLTVYGNVYLMGTAITSIPESLTVRGNLYIANVAIPESVVGCKLNLTVTSAISPPIELNIGCIWYLDHSDTDKFLTSLNV